MPACGAVVVVMCCCNTKNFAVMTPYNAEPRLGVAELGLESPLPKNLATHKNLNAYENCFRRNLPAKYAPLCFVTGQKSASLNVGMV